MSTRYPGGIISKTAPVPTGGESGTAPGVWTLEQAAYYIKQGQWPTPFIPKYVEDVFSTYLYTGNGSTQTITNGINLSGNGGLVWIKARNTAGYNHALFDTVRGVNNRLKTDTTDAQNFSSAYNNTFNSDGFSIGAQYVDSGVTFASWTFREQAKFFDIVTYTGTGVARTIAHNLGSVPGCIIVKKTSGIGGWMTYHRSTGATQYLFLNTTDAAATATEPWNNTAPTSSVFTVGTSNSTNQSGETYVAYLFAHNAGGFGLTGNDNVISCGSFSATGSTLATVNLGYEPQWLLIKGANIINGWSIIDNMRKFTANNGVSWLQPNTSAAEGSSSATYPGIYLTSTGFTVNSDEPPLNGTGNYIYIAIRRGPMRTPTLGTDVFTPISNATPTTGCLTDLTINRNITAGQPTWAIARLTNQGLQTESATSEFDTSPYVKFDRMVGVTDSGWQGTSNVIWWNFRRAPSFFDVVCYTGTGTAQNVNHNLGVVPELMIIKRRNSTTGGVTYSTLMSPNKIMELFSNFGSGGALSEASIINTDPTSTTFNVRTDVTVNASGATYVAYLFATCAGVSKVGTYTGTGTTQAINCGFTGSARFVLIKRTDSSGDWYVWDSARGIVAGNDPYVLLNSTAAQVTSTDYVDVSSTGFELSSTAPSGINANGGTYLFLAIA